MGLINLDIGSVIAGVGNIIDDMHTSDEERMKISLEEKAMDVGLSMQQMKVNEAEAGHRSLFVAGWRPCIGWVGATAVGYKFVFYPLIAWAWVFIQAKGFVPQNMTAPPSVNAAELYPIILGMLGLGGFRSIEKIKRIAK